MKNTIKFYLLLVLLQLFIAQTFGQTTFESLQNQLDSLKTNMENTKPHGVLWGYVFGDFDYKRKADTVGNSFGSPGRGSNQYGKMPKDAALFQMRRVYLGYNYDINQKFSAEILLAAEDDFYPLSGNQTSYGDVLTNNKFAPYIKLANIRWKNIYSGADLVFGQVSTPAFPLLSESTWGYRSIEKTIADIRKTPSFDQGFTLQAHIGKDANYGYNLMVGNGTGAKPENSPFLWFYGDVWAKFWKKRIVIDLYQDYQRLNWTPIKDGISSAYHSDKNMTKLFIAFQVPKFTLGLEAYTMTLMGDIVASSNDSTYYKTTIATDVSVFARGRVYKDKLGFFARYDSYDPSHKLNDIINDKRIVSYAPTTTYYDPTTKETFFTAGIDYTPFPNVHIMPNVWMNTYSCTLPSKDFYLNLKSGSALGTDLVYRFTVYYLFGKKEGIKF